MRHLIGVLLAVGSLIFTIAALAQSATSAPTVQANPAPAAPVAPSKRFACTAAAQGLKGQERADQLQLCMAQARLDCLKQAIDQKVVGPERKEFIRS